jgi:hypothetical protein
MWRAPSVCRALPCDNDLRPQRQHYRDASAADIGKSQRLASGFLDIGTNAAAMSRCSRSTRPSNATRPLCWCSARSRRSVVSQRLQVGDHLPDLVRRKFLAPRRHQRSWTSIVDGPEHLLRIEFRRSEVGRDTSAFRFDSVTVVAAGIEKDLAAGLHRVGVGCEWIRRGRRSGRSGLISRCRAENADRRACRQNKNDATYRHVDQ